MCTYQPNQVCHMSKRNLNFLQGAAALFISLEATDPTISGNEWKLHMLDRNHCVYLISGIQDVCLFRNVMALQHVFWIFFKTSVWDSLKPN